MESIPKRIHTTNKKIIDKSAIYPIEAEPDLCAFKPRGLWYGMGWAWHELCIEGGFDEGVGENDFELDIETTDILIISKAIDLESIILKPVKTYAGPDLLAYGIDWRKIKKKYKGIEVLNHFTLRWEFQLKDDSSTIYMFLDELDCDSGCIWDLSCLNGWKILKK